MRRGFKADAERLSLNFRSRLGLQDIDALPARSLAGHLGISILTPHIIPGIPEEVVSLVCNNPAGAFSAVTILVAARRIVIHNPNHSPARQESDLMHEISHVVCEHKYEDESLSMSQAFSLRIYNPEYEEEAKYLGGCLQAPREALIRHIARGKTVGQVAALLGASEDLVQFRINSTGVMRQMQRCSH